MSVRLSRRSSYSRTSRRTDYSVAPTGSVLHSKSFICKLAGWGKLEPRLDSSAAVGRFFGPVPLFWTDKPNRHVDRHSEKASGGATRPRQVRSAWRLQLHHDRIE
jgi:hypothetical protein